MPCPLSPSLSCRPAAAPLKTAAEKSDHYGFTLKALGANYALACAKAPGNARHIAVFWVTWGGSKHNCKGFRFLSPLHLTRVVTSYTYIDSLAVASAPIGRYRDTSPHVLDTRPAPAPTWLTLAHAPSCAPHAPTSLRCPPGCGLPQAQHTLRLGPGASLAQPHPRPSSEPSSARPRNAAHAVPHSRAPSTANHG